MEEEIQNIDFTKATTNNTVTPKILKISCNKSVGILHNLFNECLITGSFLDNLKLADITPVFKKKDPPQIKKTADQSVSYLVVLKFLKNLCKKNKWLNKQFFISLLMRL